MVNVLRETENPTHKVAPLEDVVRFWLESDQLPVLREAFLRRALPLFEKLVHELFEALPSATPLPGSFLKATGGLLANAGRLFELRVSPGSWRLDPLRAHLQELKGSPSQPTNLPTTVKWKEITEKGLRFTEVVAVVFEDASASIDLRYVDELVALVYNLLKPTKTLKMDLRSLSVFWMISYVCFVQEHLKLFELEDAGGRKLTVKYVDGEFAP